MVARGTEVVTTDRRGDGIRPAGSCSGFTFIANIGLPFRRRASGENYDHVERNPNNTARRISRRRLQEPASPVARASSSPFAPRVGRERHTNPRPLPAGQAPPLKVLGLIKLFNTQHTALGRTSSHKTRQERGQFLRRFFRDLKLKAGFKTVPDPPQPRARSTSMPWCRSGSRAHLAPATIQTYLSFLRGLAMWMGKHGFRAQAGTLRFEPGGIPAPRVRPARQELDRPGD